MKKYMFCFLLFAATSLLCLGIGFVITRDSVQPEEAIPGATLETETVTEDQIVINQEKVSPAPEKEKEKFYLVSEDGYLLVLYQDKTTSRLSRKPSNVPLRSRAFWAPSGALSRCGPRRPRSCMISAGRATWWAFPAAR